MGFFEKEKMAAQSQYSESSLGDYKGEDYGENENMRNELRSELESYRQGKTKAEAELAETKKELEKRKTRDEENGKVENKTMNFNGTVSNGEFNMNNDNRKTNNARHWFCCAGSHDTSF